VALLARPRGDANAAVAALRRAVESANPDVTVEVQRLDRQVADSIARERVLATVSSFFGGLGLLLAAVGLYGVLSYLTTTRRREFGVRLALGATPAQLHTLVLREVLLVTTLGLAAGTALAFAAGRFIASLLFAVTPADPVAWAIAAITLAAVAWLAGTLPARRAARTAPMTALREE
jgi:ABC-type antimicrobial peptide transport system permease subunit